MFSFGYSVVAFFIMLLFCFLVQILSYSGSYAHCTYFVRAYVPSFSGKENCAQFKAVSGVTNSPKTSRYVIISDKHTGIVDGGYFYDVRGGGSPSEVRKKDLATFNRVRTDYMGTSVLKYYDF